ncbi:inner spore coat protein H [Collibacillus ludicampi]|uniref:Inner spore coat protein H n=1 Tax=Collibacillus ludicampi TaxID=2771369 RepID=A0AAV4LBT1_9BACL|nr:CotH kinase family protein [Collibacillus ludicampi]GIM45196.1 inner spore coat protein H [Collibacillus ludicampi]
MNTSQHVAIPSYFLYIHPYDLQELRRDIWCDDPLPARLKVGKNQYIIDIAYRGSHIREFRKKSYNLKFVKPETFQGNREIHLNAEYIDPSMIRNKLSLDFFRDIGTLSPETQHIFLKLNGTPAGIYLQLESVDDLFLKRRGLPQGAIYYAINDNANFSLISPIDDDVKKSLESGYERKCGTEEDDGYLRELIYKINTIPRADFGKEITKYVAVDKYLRWLIGVICTQNFDGFIHNYALYRNNETGLFEMIPWDYDATWGRDCNGKIMEYDYVPIEGYNTLTARILDVSSFRMRYKQLLEEILETQFTVAALEPKVISMYTALRPFVLLDPYKQKDIRKFDTEPEFILKFVADRNRYLRECLANLKA